MLTIRTAKREDYNAVLHFYNTLIDDLKTAPYRPRWEKGVYPAPAWLKQAIWEKTLYVGFLGETVVSAMVVNQTCNEEYKTVAWRVDASQDEVMFLHALGVHQAHARQGIAGQMVRHAIREAAHRNKKALRLDALLGNLPAERLYRSLGFWEHPVLSMFFPDTGWLDFRIFEMPLPAAVGETD